MYKTLPIYSNRALSVTFDNDRSVGIGVTDNHMESFSDISVGVGGISGKYDFPFSGVSDLAFTQTAVTLCHEYGHYVQNYGSDKSIQTAISEVSAVGNPRYYLGGWKEFPHEIKAETTGVMLGWDMMKMVSSEKADVCMLEYVNYRAERTSYMLPAKDGGYQSRDEVAAAFDKAMEKALREPRTPQARFLQYPDESVQLLMQGHQRYKDSPNAYHVDKLIDRMPGEQKDKMMAALVVHVHPDVLEERPILHSADLSVEHVFGQPLQVGILPKTCPVKRSQQVEAMRRIEALSDSIQMDQEDDDYEFSG